MSVKIGVVIGSNRPSRVGPTVAKWFMDEVKDTPNVEFHLVDLAELKLPFFDEPESPMKGNYQNDHTKKWAAIVESLDGFVFVTPEYNHGHVAYLKNAIDFLYAEWSRKPVAFVGYGAMGAVRAIEQLMPVLGTVGAVGLNSTGNSVAIIDVWAAFDENGKLNPEKLKVGTPENLVKNLLWWAEALKAART